VQVTTLLLILLIGVREDVSLYIKVVAVVRRINRFDLRQYVESVPNFDEVAALKEGSHDFS